jgi:hypothetical protein
MNQAKIVKEAELVILNNPFEFFCEKEQQRKIWLFLKENITSGSTLISVPDLESTFANLEVLMNYISYNQISNEILIYTDGV